MNMESFLSGLSRFQNDMVQRRRDFHRHPESGWTEYYTTASILSFLKKENIPFLYGYEIINPNFLWGRPDEEKLNAARERAVKDGADPELIEAMKGLTGACAVIETGKPGPIVALRFDIDCNDVEESREADRQPAKEHFCSEHAGCMHACGHDGHATIGLYVCKVLNEIKSELCGTIKVIFQPAEEGVRGAQSIAEGGILDDVDLLLTGHLGMGWETGSLVALSHGFLSTTKLDAVFTGTPAHAGASPQDGHNAVLAACSAVLAMHTACQDSRGAARINVGTIQGGSGRNVVPGRAMLQIETRGETSEINDTVYSRAIDSLEGAAKMFGCTVQSEIKGRAASCDSSPELEPVIAAGAAMVPEITRYVPDAAFSGSEDAAYLLEKVKSHGGKAAYMCIGSDIAAPHHNSRFTFDETSLLIALKLYTAILWEILHEKMM